MESKVLTLRVHLLPWCTGACCCHTSPSIDRPNITCTCLCAKSSTYPTYPTYPTLPYHITLLPCQYHSAPHILHHFQSSHFLTFTHVSPETTAGKGERGTMGCIIICNPITSAAHCCLRHALKKGGPSLPSLSKLYSSSIDACSSLLSRACSTLYQPAAWSKISSILCHPAICHICGLLPQI